MDKNLYFHPGYTFKLIKKIELKGPEPLIVNIIVNYCCTRVLLYAKMLKKTADTKLFLLHIYHWWHLDLGERPGPVPPLHLATLMTTTQFLCAVYAKKT